MSDLSLFHGKVVKRVLPVIDGSEAASAPAMKRLMLSQGELAQFCDGQQPIRYLAAVELRPGCDRGNHYHLAKEEWVYVLTGRVQLAFQEPATGERASFVLGVGELAVIQPGIAHVLRPLEPGLAIEYSPARFDPADTVRFPVPA
jgi:mannose-6-phosphate isomerase-like protein (cupin superfamily)